VGVTSSDSQSTQDVEELIRSGLPPAPGTVFDGQQWIDEISEVLEGNTDSDFLTVLTSESETREFHGIDGFREAISDWISPYAEFRIVIEDVIGNENKLVFLAKQIATTKHGGVEVETDSASVWWVRDDLIAQIVFYLDRAAALKAAGIDPGRLEAD
jgi:ketosteroid isomerase-like protein